MGKRKFVKTEDTPSSSSLDSDSNEDVTLDDDDLVSSSGSSESEHSDVTSPDASSDSDDDKEVELSFESYNMDKKDFHAIKQFLLSTFGKGVEGVKGGECGRVDLSGLSRLITDIFSEYVGTTAKSGEEEDPLAFISFLPLESRDFHGEMKEEDIICIKNLVELLLETSRKAKVTDKKHRQLIETALTETENSALIIHERFMNLPAQVAAPLYRQLLDDLQPAVEESRAFDPKNYLILVPIYRELASTIDRELIEDEAGPSNKGKRKKAKVHEDTLVSNEDYQYYYDECLLMEELSSAHWDFRIKTPHETADSRRAFGDRGVDPARRVFLLTGDAFKSFVEQCGTLI